MAKKYLIMGIGGILILAIGVSFAYFTAQMTGNAANVSATAAQIGAVSYTAQGVTTSNTKILPGWSSGAKSVVVTRQASSVDVTYTCTLHITENDFTDMVLAVSGDNYVSAANKTLTALDTDVVIASGTITASNASVTKTTYYTVSFPETYGNQNTQKEADFTGTVTCELSSGTIYYNNDNQSGTTSQPALTLVNQVLSDNTTRLTRSDFSTSLSTTNTGTLYTTTNTEDGSTVYYFAGNALNNWVKFGKCTNSSYNCTVGEDLYWRIIRTNEDIEDRGIRLLYAGSGSVANENAYIKTAVYSGSKDDPMYAGYMWGTSGSLANNRTNQINKSNVATEISAWYTATFNASSDANSKDSSGNLYHNYISSTAIYCNDRSVSYGSYNTGSTAFYFGASFRLGSGDKIPSYACGANDSGYGNYYEGTPSIADKFTGSATNSQNITIGNGLLGNTPAALITADEIAFAGGGYNLGAYTWYHYNAATTPGSSTGSYAWWTMTPNYWYNKQVTGFYVSAYNQVGRITDMYVNISERIRPVISLKASVLWDSGDGSPSSPYTVKLGN